MTTECLRRRIIVTPTRPPWDLTMTPFNTTKHIPRHKLP